MHASSENENHSQRDGYENTSGSILNSFKSARVPHDVLDNSSISSSATSHDALSSANDLMNTMRH